MPTPPADVGPLLMPGTVIQYGDEAVTVGAVGCTGGERYYWLSFIDGAVAMLPADVVEVCDVVRR